MDFLLVTTVADVTKDEQQDLVVIPSDSSIEKAFQLLVDNDIYSAPVQNSEGTFIGLAEIKDFVDYILLIYGKGPRSIDELKLDKTAALDIQNIINFSKSNPFVYIEEGASIYKAIKLLSATKLRRFAIMNSKKQVLTMLSQSTVVKFIYNNIDKFSACVERPLSDFFGKEPVITIAESKTALDALEMISLNKVSGIAIVNAQGEMTGNISVTDLKFAANKSDKLLLPLVEFWHESPSHLGTIIDVSLTDTIKDALAKLVQTKVHRLYVLDGKKPVNVISLSDFLDVFSTMFN
eukprot:TRINITY_DN531_c0_g1_i1.p1 TRINITY_DN531_c0_g1~~TRINITY_DN531_c0_g1_i1.p1  ORF type:complete len:293 (-),score=48.80 TRINITY_DN531_c0_g1_i1:78-956(-)